MTERRSIEMSEEERGLMPVLTIYTTRWCGDCTRTKSFLRRNLIPFEEIDIEHDHEAAATVIRLNKGNRSVPTLVFPDGSILTEPSNRELAAKLEI